ncbi:MAG: hypothetical protein ACJA2S_001372 [Cyclobacteriaceae bacterium]|jgi:hypothetical protein
MKHKKKMLWGIRILIVSSPFLFVYQTFVESKGCNQLVIDTFEVYSGINIPKVNSVNCYYGENLETRISIYDVPIPGRMSFVKFDFEELSMASDYFRESLGLLAENERPNSNRLLLASGEKWGRKWTYLFDPNSDRLWASLNFEAD